MRNVFIITLLILASSYVSAAEKQFIVMTELGSVWQNRNDTQISPSTGTRMAIDEFDSGPFFHYRLEGYYKMNNKHALRAVYAPLDFNVSGKTEAPVVFNGESFDGTRNLDVRFKFNSYRLTYIYSFWDSV